MGYYLTLTSTLQLVFDLAFFLNFFLSNSSFSERVTLYVLLRHSKSNNDYIGKYKDLRLYSSETTNRIYLFRS